jgi:nicotinate-nucleotide adenylyltransferase
MGPGGRRAIGILGGTFDPIHVGHLALARQALRSLDLEQVLFVPNAQPPHKLGQPISPAHDRESMVSLAIADEPAFALSRLELERAGPSFAVDTVEVLASASRAEGRPEPWFILSAEVLDDFHAWREPLRILELCRVAVGPRPGADPLDRAWLVEHYPGREDRFTFLPGPTLDVASTTIRQLVAAGSPITGLVPGPVERYIRDTGLYLGEPGGSLTRVLAARDRGGGAEGPETA